MLKVIGRQRKTHFLTPSGLRCLAGLPTVNVSAGCAHGCVYCYTKGYSVYPGDDIVEMYEDMPQRISDEIQRKRKKPAAVYFCPSCDPFQPIAEIQQISFEVMRILLERKIGVQFVTKGRIREDTLALFRQHSQRVCGQVGITCVDDDIRQEVEPNTATAAEKLAQLKELVDMGVKMCARCDPLIHGWMDSQEQLAELFRAIAATGCREAAVSYLFLRPTITKGLRETINDGQLLERILEPYGKATSLPVGMKNSVGTMLPIDIRRGKYTQIAEVARNFKISVHICGCKNCDITNDTCYITRPPDKSAGLFG